MEPENLAAQRAQLLSSLLPAALAFGTTDPINEEALKVWILVFIRQR